MAAVAAVTPQGIQIPQKLLNFFTRYPPTLYAAKSSTSIGPAPGARLKAYNRPAPAEATSKESLVVPVVSNTSSEDANAPAIETTVTVSQPPASSNQTSHHNPFLPWRNPDSGAWRGPAYSLRRQADLVKLARQHGIEELLPPGRKSTAFKEQRLVEIGLRVKGTGEGHKVKGHKWERNLQDKLDKRKKAMEEMPAMIKLWKEVSHTTLMVLGLMRGSTSGVEEPCLQSPINQGQHADLCVIIAGSRTRLEEISEIELSSDTLKWFHRSAM